MPQRKTPQRSMEVVDGGVGPDGVRPVLQRVDPESDFWARLCFLSEFLRVSFALAACIASVLVGAFFLAGGGGASFPTVGMVGPICVGRVRSCPPGCITIGMSGLVLAMAANVCPATSFEAPDWNRSRVPVALVA